MSNETTDSRTISTLTEDEQTRIVGNALYLGAQQVGIKLPPAKEEVRKIFSPIVKEVCRRFGSRFAANDFTDAFTAAAAKETAVGVEHYSRMSLEYALAVLGAWQSEKRRRAEQWRQASAKQSGDDWNKDWARWRLNSLAAVYKAIKDGEPLSLNPESALAVQVEGRLEALGYACDHRERWKLPQLLTDAIITRGVSMEKFLGGLLPAKKK